MKKIVFILSIFCIVATAMYAQSESLLKERVAVPKKSLVFNFGYNFPSISNTLINSDWNKGMGTGMEFGVDFRKQFQTNAMEDDDVVLTPRWFAMGIGLGISYFNQSATFKNDSLLSFPYVDKDKDACTVNLKFKDAVKESVSMTYLDIPLYLEIGKPSRVKTSAYFKLGVKASLLVSDNFSGKGNYIATGEYGSPLYVTLHGIDELGYSDTPQDCYDNPKYKLSPFVIWGNVAAGINIPLGNPSTWIFRIGVKADYSLTPVSKALKDTDLVIDSQNSAPVYRFSGPNYPFSQSNLLGGDGSKIFSFGLTLGLIYCFQ